ncbi:hypothetical protein EMIHUDRAFT_444928 [Emiliania huxleyi CCMP1516]|uniref:Chitin-binding type-4 domain-containing protein n=4 Tax=Emiliania huxleyi TaxID=2903 RepID=A0A0D3J6Y3_EMIH1|nr:hypothetical protein EMIHUDRAFT_444926 [Emiliania huxleyi CCMP1516]XP_005771697.1 hypothetical protein EMIHUDRAFT_444928 [Emiliania huxleyi CCMP1516]EOD19267.1 hypothetical protein EMIHUDRAFT_444926 [Emiliania huxleyi CCMP1516]EOD19268.1 hypothetical protein EMIHUDRAFT_444928 [Emiliania huxleyi CCMP1516]|eukprot:XP_005771696.1 hypothetical protein EMIHUDRAFT_444926 [Emiliania huxleyi CCMP1516]
MATFSKVVMIAAAGVASALPVKEAASVYHTCDTTSDCAQYKECQGQQCECTSDPAYNQEHPGRWFKPNQCVDKDVGSTCLHINNIIVENKCGFDIDMVGFGGPENKCKLPNGKNEGDIRAEDSCQTIKAHGKDKLQSGTQQHAASTRLAWRFSWQGDSDPVHGNPKHCAVVGPDGKCAVVGSKLTKNTFIEMNVGLTGPGQELCIGGGATQGQVSPSFSNYQGFSMSSEYYATFVDVETPACEDYAAKFDYKVATCPKGGTPADCLKEENVDCPALRDGDPNNSPEPKRRIDGDWNNKDLCPDLNGACDACITEAPNLPSLAAMGLHPMACDKFKYPDEKIRRIYEASKCVDPVSGQWEVGFCGQDDKKVVNFWCGSPLGDASSRDAWTKSIQPNHQVAAGSLHGCRQKKVDLHVVTCPSGDWQI